MKENVIAESLAQHRLNGVSKHLRFAVALCIIIGAVMIAGAFLGVETQRVYQVYLVNFAFWTGLAQAGVVFAAAYRMTNARWSNQFKRIGELFVGFLPVSLILLVVVLLTQQSLYPWISEPVYKKAAWLNVPFFTLRIIIYFGVMTVFSLYYVALSIRPDLGLIRQADAGENSGNRFRRALATRLTRNWKGFDEEYRRSQERLKVLTPVFLITYAVLYTFAGFDLLMTLDPHWFSTLYGWIFIVSGFYSAVAAIILAGYFVRNNTDAGRQLTAGNFHDMGKLLLGFCMFTGGLVWSQYLTIWYGNIPEETAHIITRFHEPPWAVPTTVVIVAVYFFPLVILFSRRVKETPLLLSFLGVFILCALWFNRFIDAIPSIWDEPYIPFGIYEVGVTAGFLGVIAACWLWIARLVPLIPAKPE